MCVFASLSLALALSLSLSLSRARARALSRSLSLSLALSLSRALALAYACARARSLSLALSPSLSLPLCDWSVLFPCLDLHLTACDCCVYVSVCERESMCLRVCVCGFSSTAITACTCMCVRVCVWVRECMYACVHGVSESLSVPLYVWLLCVRLWWECIHVKRTKEKEPKRTRGRKGKNEREWERVNNFTLSQWKSRQNDFTLSHLLITLRVKSFFSLSESQDRVTLTRLHVHTLSHTHTHTYTHTRGDRHWHFAKQILLL